MSATAFTQAELAALPEGRTGRRFLAGRLFPVGMWFLAHPWPAAHWSVQLFWTVLTGYCLFCWTSCFHETVHHTLCRSQKTNIVFGRLLGMVMCTPYTAYRETHIRHHAYLNRPNDWELWPYTDPHASRLFRIVFAWCDLLLGSITAPYIYGRIFFHRNSPLTAPAQRAAVRMEYLLSLLVWGMTLGLVAWFDAWHGLVTTFLVPYALAGMLQTGRKFTEHLGMQSFDPLLGTRTVIGQNAWTRLCTEVNFDIFIHGPHHRHPRMAHRELASKMHEYEQQHPETPYPVYSTYTRAIRAMLPFLLFNPGSGLNAGGNLAEPTSDSPPAEDFVSDVCEPAVSAPSRSD